MESRAADLPGRTFGLIEQASWKKIYKLRLYVYIYAQTCLVQFPMNFMPVFRQPSSIGACPGSYAELYVLSVFLRAALGFTSMLCYRSPDPLHGAADQTWCLEPSSCKDPPKA